MNEIDFYKKLQGCQILHRIESDAIIRVHDYNALNNILIDSIVEYKCVPNSVWYIYKFETENDSSLFANPKDKFGNIPMVLISQYILENIKAFQNHKNVLMRKNNRSEVDNRTLIWINIIIKDYFNL